MKTEQFDLRLVSARTLAGAIVFGLLTLAGSAVLPAYAQSCARCIDVDAPPPVTARAHPSRP